MKRSGERKKLGESLSFSLGTREVPREVSDDRRQHCQTKHSSFRFPPPQPWKGSSFYFSLSLGQSLRETAHQQSSAAPAAAAARSPPRRLELAAVVLAFRLALA